MGSSTTLKLSFLLATILMLSAPSTSDDSKDKDECTQSLAGLATCLPYVGGTAKSPTPDCCTGLSQVLKTSKKCLCVVIKDANDPAKLGLTINVTLALTLPDVCNAPANISHCPDLLNLPPNSPDAQIFYQLGKNGSSIAAGGPSNSAVPNPTSAPAGVATSPPESGGCGKGRSKGWIGGEILLVGLVLLPVLIM